MAAVSVAQYRSFPSEHHPRTDQSSNNGLQQGFNRSGSGENRKDSSGSGSMHRSQSSTSNLSAGTYAGAVVRGGANNNLTPTRPNQQILPHSAQQGSASLGGAMSSSSKLQAVTGAQTGASHKSSNNTASFPIGNENVNSSYTNGFPAPGQKGFYHSSSPQQVPSPGNGNSPAHSPVAEQQYAQTLMLQQAYLQQQQYMQALLHQQQQRPRTQSNTSLQHNPQQHGYPSPYAHPSQQQQPHFFPQNPYAADSSSPAHMLPPQNFGHPSFIHQPSYSPQQLPSHFIPPQQFRQNGAGTPHGHSPVNSQQQYFTLPPPNAPFAMNGSGSRPSSPSGSIGASNNGSDGQARARTESQQKDGRLQQSPYAHPGNGAGSPSGSSDTSDARRTLPRTHSHSPSPSLGSNFPGSYTTPSLSIAQERARTNSERSAQSSEAVLAGRSASPVGSDRATTPTSTQYPASSSSSISSGRTTPTAAVNGSGHAHSASASSTLSVAQQVSFTHGIARKASPLSQTAASVRSMTPTQGPATVNGHGVGSRTATAEKFDGGNESDDTASDKREPKGHKTTNSNASSTASSSNSYAAPVSSTQKGQAPSNSIFKSKIRKALSLSELNGQGNESVSSLSTSDTSYASTMEPRTPPNGVSPVLPNHFASASASNLHAGIGRERQGSSGTTAGGSVPHNGGRRFGLLNSRMNQSQDNISISSTVSSASVMLRKMGNLGKMARKSSVKSLSNLFHRGERSASSDSLRSDAVSEFGVPGTLSAPKDRRKGGASSPHVAYVTAELESGASPGGMTPAAALVRKHQEKERAQLEAEQKAAAALAAAQRKSAIPMSPTGDSPRSRLLEKEKEKLKNNKKNGGKKFGGLFGGKKDKELQQSQASPADSEVETVVPHAASPVAEVESVQPQLADSRPSLDGITFDSWRKAPPSHLHAGDPYGDHDFDHQNGLLDDDDDDDEGFDDQTPRQSIEVLGDDGRYHGQSAFDDDTASFKAPENDSTIHSFGPGPAPGGGEENEDDGGHDGRSGQKIPDRPSKHAKPVKGILKYAASYNQETQGKPRPIATRPRSSSYDAPHQMSPPNQPGHQAALVQSIPSEDQIDGVAERASFTAPRLDTRASSPTQIMNQHAEHENGSPTTSAAQPFTSPYGNPSLNASAPVLANPSSVQMNVRSVTGPLVKRKISFAANLSVHTTWPGTIYDRRAEPSTCNKLTPTLAQQIKEELNAFKMEEMEVHYSSRNHTQFFV